MPDTLHPPLAVVILAGGTGGRMNSARPKPLHSLAGTSLLHHTIRAARALAPRHLAVVVGAEALAVSRAVRDLAPEARIAVQPKACGTGNAALCALSVLDGFKGRILVLYADTPLTRPATLRKLVEAPGAVAALGFETATPYRYGRLIRDASGGLDRIVEACDATPAEAAVTLCNAGVMAFDAEGAGRWLPALSNDNDRGEYFLTDLVALARAEGRPCAIVVAEADEALGVNSRAELAAAEAAFQRRARSEALEGGATMIAPETVYFSYDTQIGRDVMIGPHVVFAPGVTVEDEVVISPFACFANCALRRGTRTEPFAGLREPPGLAPGDLLGRGWEPINPGIYRDLQERGISFSILRSPRSK